MRKSVAVGLGLVGIGALAVMRASAVERRFRRELRKARPPFTPEGPAITEAELASLPAPARRLFRHSGALGRPRDSSFYAELSGEFRLSPDKPFVPIHGVQYDSRGDGEVARLFHMVMPFGSLPVVGRDTYLRGNGRLSVKAIDLLTVEDAGGEEFDRGELVTFLNDAILYAPSMLLAPRTEWIAVNHGAFDVTLMDSGHVVSARVFVDEHGAVTNFQTSDRFVNDPYERGHPLVQRRWSTPVGDWTEVDGRRIPLTGQAMWHLPQGAFTYARFQLKPETVRFNAPPLR